MEVCPTQSQPASQQGGGGRRKPGWRSLGEVGGWRFLDIPPFCFQTNQSEEIICKKVKVIFKWMSDFTHLCAVDWRFSYHVPFFSRVGEEEIRMKVKVLSLILTFVDFSVIFYQCLKRA